MTQSANNLDPQCGHGVSLFQACMQCGRMPNMLQPIVYFCIHGIPFNHACSACGRDQSNNYQ